VEKDYYVTLILKLLSEQLGKCVFKGGTSLSKGFFFFMIHYNKRKKNKENAKAKRRKNEIEYQSCLKYSRSE